MLHRKTPEYRQICQVFVECVMEYIPAYSRMHLILHLVDDTHVRDWANPMLQHREVHIHEQICHYATCLIIGMNPSTRSYEPRTSLGTGVGHSTQYGCISTP